MGLVSRGPSACTRIILVILSQIIPSCQLSQSFAYFHVTISPYYCFSELFFLFALPFPFSLPFFPWADVSIICTGAFLCPYYRNCDLQYKMDTFVFPHFMSWLRPILKIPCYPHAYNLEQLVCFICYRTKLVVLSLEYPSPKSPYKYTIPLPSPEPMSDDLDLCNPALQYGRENDSQTLTNHSSKASHFWCPKNTGQRSLMIFQRRVNQ